MIRQDYFLRMAEQLALVLARALKLKRAGHAQAALELIDEQYAKLLKSDSHTLAAQPVAQLIDMYQEGQLALLAELMAAEGEVRLARLEPEAGQRRLEQAIALYEHLNRVQQVFDFEREGKMQHLRALLASLK